MTVLAVTSNGFTLEAGAAASCNRMIAAAGALPITSAYRDPARQAELYAGWIARRPGYNLASPPSKSQHCKGLAVDFAPGSYRWLEANAAGYGWRRTTPSERWHYEYTKPTDRHIGDRVPAPPATPAQPKEEDDDMGRTIEALYRTYLDRAPSAGEVDSWIVAAIVGGFTAPAALRVAFMASHSEAGTARAAYRTYLRRGPSPAEIAAWTDSETIAQVFAGVAGSNEAKAAK